VQISNGMSEILDWYRCNIAEKGLLDRKIIILVCSVPSGVAILESKALESCYPCTRGCPIFNKTVP
jgi:hypothetical protein